MRAAARKAFDKVFRQEPRVDQIIFQSDGRAARQRPDRQPTEWPLDSKTICPNTKDQAKNSNMRKQTNDKEKCINCRCGNAGNDCDDAAARGITECQGK